MCGEGERGVGEEWGGGERGEKKSGEEVGGNG